MWNEEAWQTHLELVASKVKGYGSTSASRWRWYDQGENDFFFLNDQTAETMILTLNDDEIRWLLYRSTIKSPTKRLDFYHGNILSPQTPTT